MLDISTIYCSATGKPIATINDDELGLLLESCPSNIELESRCILSMRPSTVWMNVTPDSLEAIRVHAPQQLLAYLMNRLYAPDIRHETTRVFNIENRIAAYRLRIELWEIISNWQFADDELAQINMLLLELDSRFNLSKLQRPSNIPAILTINDSASRKLWLDAMVDWRDKLVERQLRENQANKLSLEWWAGSKLTRKAFGAAFLTTKPLSKSAEKKLAKVKESNLINSILDNLFADEDDSDSTPTIIVAKPAKVAVVSTKSLSFAGLKFGVK